MKYSKCVEKITDFPDFNPNPVLKVDSHGSLLYCNESAYDLFESLDINSPESFKDTCLYKAFKDLNEETLLDREVKVKEKVFSFSFSKDNCKDTVYMYGYEITDLKTIQAKLISSRDYYLKILDDAPALIWRANINAECDWFNKEWLAFTGRTLEQEVGNGWAEGVHKDDFDRCLDTFLTSFKKRVPFEMEYRLLHNSGEYRWILDCGKPAFETDGSFKGYIGYCFDISQKIETQKNLVQAVKKAEESDRLKSAFLANMSHEIRTPMNAILGFTELILSNNIDSEIKKYLEIINYSGENLLVLINDILDLSKIEANQIKLTYKNVELIELLQNIKESFIKIIEVKNKQIDLKISVPENYEKLYIRTDPNRLNQVLTNLLNNAVKFTENGEIEFGFNIEDQKIHFYVKDTGIGIKEEFKKNVFQRFSREESVLSSNYSGAGLGMAISKAIIDLLGGKIDFQSEYGKGTKFKFDIPYEKGKNIGIIKSKTKDNFKDIKIKVIVAEDDENSFFLMKEFLKIKGLNIIRAKNGYEALDVLRKNRDIKLAILDMKMPKMDGYKTATKIKELYPETGIIAVTAFAMEGDEERCKGCGCDYYLRKPFKARDLYEKIDSLV